MTGIFIGIDSGTQGTKTIIFDASTGRTLAESYQGYALVESPNGKREQDPELWYDAVIKTVGEALAKAGINRADVRAIGISGQQHGMVALDKHGQVLHPAKLWCDTETYAEAEALTEELGGLERVISLTGNSIAVGFTASKVAWLKKNAPALYDQVECILLPHDYLNFRLTGQRKAEFGDASGTAYFDVKSRDWSEPVLDAIDGSGKLKSCLPGLVSSQEPVGNLHGEAAAALGLSTSVVVSSGGGDNMMAAIGTGNVKPGVVTVSLGTSGTIYAHADKPVVDDSGELAAFCSSAGGWLPLVCTMNVTVATELTRDLLQIDVASLNQKAASAPAGSEGVMLVPFFNGERTPALPSATATLAGLTSGNYTQENLCRAAMEGATYGLRYGLDVFTRNGLQASEIRLVGGGARSVLWRQIVADVFDCAVVSPVVGEAGALGAALQALWCHANASGGSIGIEEITDNYVRLDPESRATPGNDVATYAEGYQQYLELERALRTTYRSTI